MKGCPLSGEQVFKQIGIPAVKLLFIPGVIEAFFDGGMAIALFGMPPLFGFALGFILKAIGPALVIQLMFELQQKRLGLEKSECALTCDAPWCSAGWLAGCCETERMLTEQMLSVIVFFYADMPLTVVAAASFDDMVAITG